MSTFVSIQRKLTIPFLQDELICIPWKSEFQLKNGVSLFRIHLPRSSRPAERPVTLNTVSNAHPAPAPATTPKSITSPISIFDASSSFADRLSNSELSPSLSVRKRLGVLILAEQSASSEETGFDTDTMDESSSACALDAISLSSLSNSEPSVDVDVEVNSSAPLKDVLKHCPFRTPPKSR